MNNFNRHNHVKYPGRGHSLNQSLPEGTASAGQPIPAAWWGNRPAQSNPLPETGADTRLIQQAQEINRTLDPGLANFETYYSRFHPVLRAALARETVRLARIAGVRECAAFMALVSQFEN